MRVKLISLFTKELPEVFLNALKTNVDALSVRYEPYSVSSSYTFTENDELGSLYVDTSAGDTTIYLPDSPTGVRRRTVVKTVAANVLIIDGNGATIYGPGGWAGGVAQAFLNGRWESLTFEPTGTAWAIVGSVP